MTMICECIVWYVMIVVRVYPSIDERILPELEHVMRLGIEEEHTTQVDGDGDVAGQAGQVGLHHAEVV